ncbi:hypothetical protein GE21DRAFT_6175 [Neurospora crassa]|uniref:Uncharacterized protein n=1 Tax=Neurospora crassa (strain ATCC 24698 / 74-OR23-1A / CBS 708.71 / DSM 1257 / FGSC 987) TaxID=367110 RepID=Q7RX25_NEUCR|nr:hypothetical protein NCU04351 [Neurospora crassa OR74A]EAA27096.1 hypothetical protein NCU04351 [Neurospora crassa OR74A]KHE82309.1 hypothetical protein GE21DRAFT_6175 [Neurospora crassa]|eukprot:XP_956332.1 hypothetical protein NCU04351 [Neurospora crassa OR74A]
MYGAPATITPARFGECWSSVRWPDSIDPKACLERRWSNEILAFGFSFAYSGALRWHWTYGYIVPLGLESLNTKKGWRGISCLVRTSATFYKHSRPEVDSHQELSTIKLTTSTIKYTSKVTMGHLHILGIQSAINPKTGHDNETCSAALILVEVCGGAMNNRAPSCS